MVITRDLSLFAVPSQADAMPTAQRHINSTGSVMQASRLKSVETTRERNSTRLEIAFHETVASNKLANFATKPTQHKPPWGKTPEKLWRPNPDSSPAADPLTR